MRCAAPVLRAWGWSRWEERASQERPAEDLIPARVIRQHRGAYGLITSAGEMTGVTPGRMEFRASGRRELPAVGDWVWIRPELDGPATIVEILPRRTEFVRRKAGTQSAQQVVAANVDVVFLMTSLNQEMSLRRLERFLVAARESGADAVVLLSKTDLVDDSPAAVARVRDIAGGAPVHAISSVSGDGMDLVRAYLEPGRTAALVGSSGVGKSTLINRLAGRELLRTQEIRELDDKGRHTTTHREIYQLPDGGLVLDTPGMREFGLSDASEGFQETFDDIEALIGECRFRDCSHAGEPGCAVQEALSEGRLSEDRWHSYQKIGRELLHEKRRRDIGAALTEKRRWKQIHTDQRKTPKKGS